MENKVHNQEVTTTVSYLHYGDRCLPILRTMQRSQFFSSLQKTNCHHFQVGKVPDNSSESTIPIGAHLPPDVVFWLVRLLEGSAPSTAPASVWTDLETLASTVAYLALDDLGVDVVLEWCRERWLNETELSSWATLYHTVDKLRQQMRRTSKPGQELLPLTWSKLRRVARVPYLPFPSGTLEQKRATTGALVQVTGRWKDVLYLRLNLDRLRSVLAQLIGHTFFTETEALDLVFTGEAVYSAVYSELNSQPLQWVVVDVVAFSPERLDAALRTALKTGYTLAWDDTEACFAAARPGCALRFHQTSARTPEGFLLRHPHAEQYQMFYSHRHGAAASVAAAHSVLRTTPASYSTPFNANNTPVDFLLGVLMNTQHFLVPNFLALGLPFPHFEYYTRQTNQRPFVTPFCRVVVYHKYHNELELGLELGGPALEHVRTELATFSDTSDLLYVRVHPSVYMNAAQVVLGSYVRVQILPKGISNVAHRIVPLKCYAVSDLEVLHKNNVPRV